MHKTYLLVLDNTFVHAKIIFVSPRQNKFCDIILLISQNYSTQQVKYTGKLSTTIILKFNVNMWTLCFVPPKTEETLQKIPFLKRTKKSIHIAL